MPLLIQDPLPNPHSPVTLTLLYFSHSFDQKDSLKVFPPPQSYKSTNMTAKISIQKIDVFGIDKVGAPSRVNSPLNKNHTVPESPVHRSSTSSDAVPQSIFQIHETIRDKNIQAAKSACDLRHSGIPLSLISNQLRLQIALSLNVHKATVSSLDGMRTFVQGFLKPKNQ